MRSQQYLSGHQPSVGAWQAELRTELCALLHIDDLWQAPALALDDRVVSRQARDGYTFEERTLASTPTRRISAVVTIPAGEGPFPAVVCIHGHGGDRFAVYQVDSIYKGFATELAALGYVTIAVDVGQHGTCDAGRLLMGERLWDCIRAVDWLAQEPCVDSGRIGCAGLSLGGEMSMWLGAMDTRIAAELSAGFLTTMNQMEHNHCLCWKFDGLRELVDFADIYAMTAPRPLQCQNGALEPPSQFCVQLARQALAEIEPAYRDLDAINALSLRVHPGAHEVDLQALLSFFDRCL